MGVTSAAEDSHDPGDLGRRLTERRRALGLEREEVARRAGMDPGYLEHVEERASARPSPAACARLAAALETTVAWLRGGGIDRPPGGGQPPASAPVLEVLERAECLGRIKPGGIGRVVFNETRGPVALPVNYRTLGEDIVFRTGEGAIAAAVQAGGRLSVEVDHLDEPLGEGWSVLVSGETSIVTDPDELRSVDELRIEPWAGGDRHRVIRIVATEVSGRRIRRHGVEES